MYAYHGRPSLVDCSFVVDSQNPNGFGQRSKKSAGMVKQVLMQSSPTAPGGPNLGTAGSYAILGASAVSNTGSSVVTGNLGISPGTSVTGFPPGVISGREDIANPLSARAQSDARAAYLAMQAQTATGISSILDGQTLTPGTYVATSGTAGTFALATSAPGTLTLNGAGVYVFQTSTTLTTGAGGIPTITLTGGATAANVYWVVGSSATINSGSAGTFQGTIIALTSVTDTLGGTVNGRLIALNGAVTLSAATTSSLSAGSSSGPGTGIIAVQFRDNYNRYLGGFSGQIGYIQSPGTSVVKGNAYEITGLGTATAAQWLAAGLPIGVKPAVGAAFVAAASQTIGGSASAAQPAWSGIDHIEVIGDPNLTIAPSPQSSAGPGGWIFMQCYAGGEPAAPFDNSVVGLTFYFDDSTVLPGDGG